MSLDALSMNVQLQETQSLQSKGIKITNRQRTRQGRGGRQNPKIWENIFGQMSCKIRAFLKFSDKYYTTENRH